MSDYYFLLMSPRNHVYQKIELTGTSEVSIEDAVQSAVARAARMMKNIRWFELVETRGLVEAAKVRQWQVTLKVGCTLEN
jgi:flavin-binding protein dodecin